MKLKVVDFDIDKLDFRDRLGQWRTSYGCSILGRSQFTAYLNQIYEILQQAEQKSLIALYEEHSRFQHCCNQCLELNQIEPDWVIDRGGELLRALLFENNGEAGLLIQLNTMPKSDEAGPTEVSDGSTEAIVGASILSATNSLKEALDVLNTPNGKLVMNIIAERAKAMEKAQAASQGKDPAIQKWKKEKLQRGSKKIDVAGLRRQAFGGKNDSVNS